MNRRIGYSLATLATATLLGSALVGLAPSHPAAMWRWSTFTPLLPRTWVNPVRPESPAAAAIEAFMPSRADDPAFEQLVAEALVEQARRIPANAQSHAKVTADLRRRLLASGLPESFVGIPFIESGWSTDAQSHSCAGGPWQFLPEVAVELGLRVEACQLGDTGRRFTPTDRLPPDREDRPYLGAEGCLMRGCAVDERRDLAKATEAALDYLATLYHDPTFAALPDRAIYAITAYNAGPGGTARFVERGGDDPIAWLSTCAHGRAGCGDRLSQEGARYAPRVIAAAALASCNAREAYLADWGRADLCDVLADAGWAPRPLSGAEALSLVANAHQTWTVGLLPMQAEADPSADPTTDRANLLAGAQALDAQLLEALASVPGVRVIAGVPGEDAETLVEQGAEVVLSGELGQTDARPWVRLQRWESLVARGGERHARPAGMGVFRFVESDLEGADILADALLHPAEGTRAEALAGLLEIQRTALESCVASGAIAAITLGVDGDGHANVLRADAGTQACFASVLANAEFPPELAGARARFDLGVDALADGLDSGR
jgi:hypothetical protein